MTGTITPIGVGTATLYDRQATAGAALDFLVSPGDTNIPVIFEPPPALTGGAREVWCLATGGEDWGGCQVWISTDGDTYALAGTVYRGARQGVLTADLPSAADPDTTNALAVDLAISRGQLLSGTQADADNLVTLCYVDGELVSYQTATLTSAYRYDLSYLRRGVYGTAIGSHAGGSQFARFGPNDPSVLKYPYPENYVGQTLYLKFPAFNIFGQRLQSLADVAPIAFPLTGGGAAVPSFEVAGSQSGLTAANLSIGRFAFCSTVVFANAFAGSRAAAATAATAQTAYAIKKNGSTVGTMTFDAGATTGVFTSSAGSTAFNAGDTLTIVGPASPDATLGGLAWSLLGRQGIMTPVAEAHGSQSGLTTGNLIVGRWIADNPVGFPAALAGSVAAAGIPATASTTYQVQKNGVGFGAMVFGAGAAAATFTGAAIAFNPGDVLTIQAPASPDPTLADIAWAVSAADHLGNPNSFIGSSMSGLINPGMVIGRYVFAETMIVPAGMSGSVAAAGTAGIGATAFDIRRNGVPVGTMTFAGGATVALFAMASPTPFNQGDVLTVVAPAAPDAALANLAWAIAGIR